MTGRSLLSLAERAFKWSALTTMGRFVLQLVAQIALARLLGPSNYGVYGIGMVVLTFAAFLSGNAFSYILMLQPKVDEDDVRFAFTWQLLAGLACAVGMFAAADLLAGFFGDPRVAPMVRWLSAACVLMALSGPSSCLLQRDLNFRSLGLIQLVSYAAGYLAVGVPLALAGQGAQALAAACVVQAAVQLALGFAVRPHSIKPLLRHPMGAQTLETGRTVFFTNIVNWMLANVDRIVIGRLLNAHAVGLYNVAYNLASIPNVLLTTSMQPTFLATGARLQHDRRQLGQAWLTVMACLVVGLTPMALLAALMAPDLVRVMYGPAWDEAGRLLAIMCLCLPAWTCLGLTTPVLWNTGRKHLEALLQLPLLLLVLPAWWLLAPQGIEAVVIASALLVFARAAVIIASALRALDLGWRVLLPFAARGLMLGAVVVGAAFLAREAAEAARHPLFTLASGSTAGLLAAALFVLARPQALGPEAGSVLARLVPAFRPQWATTPEPRP